MKNIIWGWLFIICSSFSNFLYRHYGHDNRALQNTCAVHVQWIFLDHSLGTPVETWSHVFTHFCSWWGTLESSFLKRPRNSVNSLRLHFTVLYLLLLWINMNKVNINSWIWLASYRQEKQRTIHLTFALLWSTGQAFSSRNTSYLRSLISVLFS